MKLTSRIMLAIAALASFSTFAAESVTVYKPSGCGCCGGWIEHMKTSGFDVKVIDAKDISSIKKSNGITANLASCHTAKVGNYVLEGHVPAADVKRLLAEKPSIRGLTVPGMPQSAPGMDKPGHPYEVLSFDKDGKTGRWAAYPG